MIARVQSILQDDGVRGLDHVIKQHRNYSIGTISWKISVNQQEKSKSMGGKSSDMYKQISTKENTMAILKIINIQINTSQSHIKIPLHTSQLGYRKIKTYDRCWQACEKLDSSYIAGGSVKQCNYFGNGKNVLYCFIFTDEGPQPQSCIWLVIQQDLEFF